MKVTVKKVEQVSVVEIAGEIDSKNAPQIHEKISALIQPEAKILLDMSQVSYMSSAGLRVLLATYRNTSSQKAHVVLTGLSEELHDIMSATGFLRFFTIYETVEVGLEALK